MEADKPTPITHPTEEKEQALAVEMPPISVNGCTFSEESTEEQPVAGATEYFKDYCQSSAIHGVRYFAENGRYRIEKIFWFAAITLSMTGCFHLIWKVWQKWDTSPVIVSFAESTTSIWEVPFPAVSICPTTKSRRSVFNFTAFFNRYSDEYRAIYAGQAGPDINVTLPFSPTQLECFGSLTLVCPSSTIKGVGNETLSEDAIRFLTEVAPPLSEMMTACFWQSKEVECSDVFRTVWSGSGLCFTFNVLDNRELFTKEAVQYREQSTSQSSEGWDLERGYPAKRGLDTTFPIRAMGAGPQYGLRIMLASWKPDLDYVCGGPLQGYSIMLHENAEMPLVGQQLFWAPLDQYVVAAVKPSMMTTSKSLHEYAPHRRQCYFPRERQLRFFQVYTKKNCDLECIANLTLKRCGCVELHMPRDNETAICGPGKMTCTGNVYDESVTQDTQNNLESLARGERPGTQRTECDCLASCFSLGYDVETTQDKLNLRNYLTAMEIPFEDEDKSLMLFNYLHLFFKDTQFTTSERKELFGITEFIANCGGLLSLFSGFSFISLIEILYFLTIRLWCRRGIRSRRRRSSAVSQPATGYDPEKTSPKDNVLPAQRF